ncbi:hypothetical protein KAR91_54755 [Candidatus Pacearchaeota archaeon]|nr:hypothetical protein [Candidatus Pacearchaeota archaeon]
MPLRFSTGAVDALQEAGCLKEILWDGVIDVLSGAQPAGGDNAETGTLLVRCTLASGAFTAGVKSTAQVDKLTITDFAEGNTYIATVNGTGYTYTAGAAESVTTVAAGLAALVDASPVVSATSILGVVTVRALYGGVSYTLVASGTGAMAKAAVVANVRINGLQFGDAVNGVLSKEAGAWSGVALASGTAGYFRFKGNAVDDGTESTVLVRMDGNISTSNAPLIVSSINIVSGTTVTIDSAAITRPKS